MEIQYRQLKPQNPIQQLYARSFEMGIYLVEIELTDGQRALLYNGERPMRFHSLTDLKKAFIDFEVKQAKLCHESPYDEMIGNGPVPAESMEIPMSMGVSSV